MNVLLYGVKGSGKTTLGQRVANTLRWAFIDTDHLLAQRYNLQHHTQLNHREIFKLIGEPAFREWEQDSILTIQPSTNTIISVGGSSLLDPSSQQHARSIATCIYCRVSLTTFLQRLNDNPNKPDHLNSISTATDYFRQRDSVYSTLSNHVFNNDGGDINVATQQLKTQINQERHA